MKGATMGKAYIVIGIIVFAVQIYAGRPCRKDANFSILMWLPDLVVHAWYADKPLREFVSRPRCAFG
jgi:hypothetical protein